MSTCLTDSGKINNPLMRNHGRKSHSGGKKGWWTVSINKVCSTAMKWLNLVNPDVKHKLCQPSYQWWQKQLFNKERIFLRF